MFTPLLSCCGLLAFADLAVAQSPPSNVRWWVTTTDLKQQLSEQPALPFSRGTLPGARDPLLEVDATRTYQTMLGLGSSLEPSTCSNLFRLSLADRTEVLRRLVSPTAGIGMNLMRICIGTPDFTGDPWYSYNDLPAGETDPELKRFSIARDRAYILPVIKLARQENPDLLFFASPWSPPGWMKTTGVMAGGSLKPEWYAAYAEYFVRFIQAYAAEGIPIHAVTVQNEPGVDRAKEKNPKWHYPSCHWTAEQERTFIRDHLGPAFRRHQLTTRIWCYDHNYNVRATAEGDDPGIAYPRTILSDPSAAAFVDGVAFHGYAGQPSGMTTFHAEFPRVPIHFTEGSVFGIRGAVELVERLRNWASSYNAWVTMLDKQGKPNNGPFDADRTAVMFNTKTGKADYLFDYFMSGQFMKFVARGAQRIDSGAGTPPLAHVGFRNPDGAIVLIVVNPTTREVPFQVRASGAWFRAKLSGQSLGTFAWPAKN